MEVWGFLWLMFALKVPIAMLLGIVWWATRPVPEDVEEPQGDGGAPVRPDHSPRPRRPTGPRRGPHAMPSPSAPPRVRSVTARGRQAGSAAGDARETQGA